MQKSKYKKYCVHQANAAGFGPRSQSNADTGKMGTDMEYDRIKLTIEM